MASFGTGPVMVDPATEHGVLFDVSDLASVLLHKGMVGNVAHSFVDLDAVLIHESVVHLVLKQVVLVGKDHDGSVLRQEISELLDLLLDPFDILVRLIISIVDNDGSLSTTVVSLVDGLVSFLSGSVPDIDDHLVVFFWAEVLPPLKVRRPYSHLFLNVEQIFVHLSVVGQTSEAVPLRNGSLPHSLISQHNYLDLGREHDVLLPLLPLLALLDGSLSKLLILLRLKIIMYLVSARQETVLGALADHAAELASGVVLCVAANRRRRLASL